MYYTLSPFERISRRYSTPNTEPTLIIMEPYKKKITRKCVHQNYCIVVIVKYRMRKRHYTEEFSRVELWKSGIWNKDRFR